MNIAQLVARGLRKAGVTHPFGNPGTTEATLLVAMHQEGIIFQMCLTENAAVAMADGYQRRSGDPTVVIVHTAAGTTAAAMGVLNAYGDRQPLLILAGDKDSGLVGRDHVAETADIAALLAPISKYASIAPEPGLVAETVAHALRVTRVAPAGPAYVAVPEDYWELPADPVNLDLFSSDMSSAIDPTGSQPVVNDKLITLAELLCQAERPVLLFGNQFGRAGRLDLATRLAELIGAHVVDELSHAIANANYPRDRPEYRGPIRAGHPALVDADVVVVLGSSLSREYSPEDKAIFFGRAKLIHVSESVADLNRNHDTALAICADPTEVTASLTALVEERGRPVNREGRVSPGPRRSSNVDRRNGSAGGKLLTIEGFARVLNEHVPRDVPIVAETVLATKYLHRDLQFTQGRTYYSTTSAGLGWGLGAAAGVAYADVLSPTDDRSQESFLGWPESQRKPQVARPTICLLGDGAFAFGLHALWSIRRLNLPILVVVINNGGYQAVLRSVSEHMQDPEELKDWWNLEPEFSAQRIADAFGVARANVSSEADLTLQVKNELASSRPFLLEARMQWGADEGRPRDASRSLGVRT